MRILALGLLSLFIILSGQDVHAGSGTQISISPTGADIKRVGESRFTVTFTAPEGGRIIAAGEGLFCYRLNVDGSCYAKSVLGSVKGASTARSEPTLVDNIVVDNNTAADARDVADSFYYVRRITVSKEGAEHASFAAFPLKLVDPTKVSLISVSVYGEDGMGDRRRAVEITSDNIESGYLTAEMSFSGEGAINGWWEIHHPGDLLMRRIDRFADASLTDQELATKRSFRPALWFHRDVKAPGNREGKLTLRGPSFKDLPMGADGKYHVLLHLLRNAEEYGNGPTGGMPLMLMTYTVGTKFQLFGDGFMGWPWLQWVPIFNNAPTPGLAWDQEGANGDTVRLVLMEGGAPSDKSLRVPFSQGRVDLPADWTKTGSARVGFTVLNAAGTPIASENVVTVMALDKLMTAADNMPSAAPARSPATSPSGPAVEQAPSSAPTSVQGTLDPDAQPIPDPRAAN